MIAGRLAILTIGWVFADEAAQLRVVVARLEVVQPRLGISLVAGVGKLVGALALPLDGIAPCVVQHLALERAACSSGGHDEAQRIGMKQLLAVLGT